MKEFLSVIVLAGMAVSGPASGGSISGKITYDGNPPPPTRIEMDGECGKLTGGGIDDPSVRLGEGNSLAHVFVQVKNAPTGASAPPPREPLVITVEDCVLQDRMVVLRVGQELRVRNEDPIDHRIYLERIQAGARTPTATAGRITTTLEPRNKPEPLFKVKCDLHSAVPPAYGQVIDHSFWAVSDENGRYRIDGLPAGTYQLDVFHEKFRFAAVVVNVPEDGEVTSDIRYGMTSPGKR